MLRTINWIAGIMMVGTTVGTLATACGDDDKAAGATATAVTGAADSHCTETVEVSQAVCHQTPNPDAGSDAGDHEHAGDGGAQSDYGPTMFNAEGDDDDCKYHIK